MAHEVIDDCVRNLKEMGYIGFKKINAKWYIYIKNNLDFLLPSEKEKYVKEYGYEK